jgi:hypothetical protein
VYLLFGQTRLIEVGWQGVRGDITDIPADYTREVVFPGWHGCSVVYVDGTTVCCGGCCSRCIGVIDLVRRNKGGVRGLILARELISKVTYQVTIPSMISYDPTSILLY